MATAPLTWAAPPVALIPPLRVAVERFLARSRFSTLTRESYAQDLARYSPTSATSLSRRRSRTPRPPPISLPRNRWRRAPITAATPPCAGVHLEIVDSDGGWL